MSELIDTTEMYLRTVYELIEEGIPPLRARIAERLHQSGPTVSQTVARMERDGLLTVQNDRQIHLSDKGQELAIAVMRKHRLVERLLTDVIGLDWELVHDEACRWEHVVSDAVEERLVALLPSVDHSPYGNPIPGLEALGLPAPSDDFRTGNTPLPELLQGINEVEFTLTRMSEYAQNEPQVLAELAAAGIRPGVVLKATSDNYGYKLTTTSGATSVVSPLIAEGLFGRTS